MGDEDPHADADFAHLRPRDREIAVFIDHLDEGHAMGYKALAAVHPRYGQQAVRTSMQRLTDAGHLCHIREHLVIEDNSMRWVTRTYWSRTRRSAEWWADFARMRKGRVVYEDHRPGLARIEEPPAGPAPEQAPPEQASPEQAPPADEPQAAPEPQATAPEPQAAAPEPQAGPAATTPAYRALAELRDTDARMPLSESECRALESLAAEWLARGSTPEDLTRALTDGLPSDVTNPGGLARRRLEDKMPPKKARIRQKAALRRARVDRVIMCCVTCDADERTVRIEGGMCPECRAEYEADLAAEAAGELDAGYVPSTFLADPDPAFDSVYEVVDVARRAAEVRAAGGLRPRAERAR
ncbi:hypothetical protein [Streptomyces sp. bgisy154]|uniref:hypothetical protein n=1 Tax=Streptomyces sp. bgisy154 TaxID=3413794 RepID=UPI003D731B0C